MGSGPIDPKELLKALDCFLGRDGEVKSTEGITKIFNPELRRLASILVSDWMAVIRSQSGSQPTEKDKKKRKEENKPKNPIPEKSQEFKSDPKNEEGMEKKREKPKSLRTTAPSHAKFRSTGLEMETPSLTPSKKTNSSSTADKYNLKPMPIKRQNTSSLCGDNPPAEKKYKPLNTTPNATKEIKVKIIPPQREWGGYRVSPYLTP
ncbi:serine/threonine-protein phosphatase 1 regulatory subunit 10 [Phasianus colchicus]|uniref:serine/threonine-protein phosphatase 1 regulatory subunit 10 n=1 Tax=Phasianus colchicus TaxID=9054 RepID=UPI00129E4A27|nr:serine/threonine-protein phosphatase 1 regulatory subunit 10 [Phasianus colchicus]